MIRARLLLWLMVLLLIWLALHLGQWPFASYLLLFLLLLPPFAGISGFLSKKRLHSQIQSSQPAIERHQMAQWTVRIENRSRLTPVHLRLRYALGPEADRYESQVQLQPRELQEVLIEMEGEHCGILQPQGLDMHLHDAFGFFRFKLSLPTSERFSEVAVMPLQLISSEDKEAPEGLLEAGEKVSQKSETLIDEIDRIRGMQPGDRMRDIHWKLSARMQSWMVRQYEKADEAQLTVLMDLPDPLRAKGAALRERRWQVRDLILDQACAQARGLLNKGCRIDLISRMPRRVSLEARTLEDLDLLRQQMARIPAAVNLAFSVQIRDEALRPGKRFYLIFLYQLDAATTAELRVLAESANGIFVELMDQMPLEVEAERAQEAYLAQLRNMGIQIAGFKALGEVFDG